LGCGQNEMYYAKTPWYEVAWNRHRQFSLPVPHPPSFRPPYFPLQTKNSLDQSFGSRWTYSRQSLPSQESSTRKGVQLTTRNINIDRHNPITTSHHAIRVMVIPTSISTASHADNPPRIRHLIIKLSQSGSHLVGKSASDDHDV
jgi:hypothetical protein